MRPSFYFPIRSPEEGDGGGAARDEAPKVESRNGRQPLHILLGRDVQIAHRDERRVGVEPLGWQFNRIKNRIKFGPKNYKSQIVKETCINCFKSYTASIKKGPKRP